MKRVLVLLFVSLSCASSCTKKCSNWEEPENGSCIEYRSLYYGEYSGVLENYLNQTSGSVNLAISQFSDSLNLFRVTIPNLPELKCKFEFSETLNLPKSTFEVPTQNWVNGTDSVQVTGFGTFIGSNKIGFIIHAADSQNTSILEFHGVK